jgi:hypothetical protein
MPKKEQVIMLPRPTATAVLILVLVLSLALAPAPAAAQDEEQDQTSRPAKPLFVRISVYPTVSLSRYDYNNDIDLAEVRVYVELRNRSQVGSLIRDAEVTALGRKLDYIQDHYEKRILLSGSERPTEIDLVIAAPGRPPVKERFPIPDWLTLTSPRPAILDPAEDLTVAWEFGRFCSPVDVSAYDFKTGKAFFQKDNQAGPTVVITSDRVPRSTIVRIYVIQSWLDKRFLSGEAYARGSEINVIPWSQVFVRTK